jgi:hypothetical protein
MIGAALSLCPLQAAASCRLALSRRRSSKEFSEGSELPPDAELLAKRRSIVGEDPLPNGLERHRKALEAIVRFAHEQKILPRAINQPGGDVRRERAEPGVAEKGGIRNDSESTPCCTAGQ